jgi:hypothetical protein
MQFVFSHSALTEQEDFKSKIWPNIGNMYEFKSEICSVFSESTPKDMPKPPVAY